MNRLIISYPVPKEVSISLNSYITAIAQISHAYLMHMFALDVFFFPYSSNSLALKWISYLIFTIEKQNNKKRMIKCC